MRAHAGWPVANPGDIGRRVAWRRERLGLSQRELAEQVGMAPSFIELLETHAVNVTWDGLTRLAYALRTRPEILLGSGVDLPEGAASAAAHPTLETLAVAECLRLISPGGVGRVGFGTDTGPEVLPVNYVLDDTGEGVVFRTRERGVIARHVGEVVAFEVDHVDTPQRTGWSVLVSGPMRHLPGPTERLRESIDVTPWAGDDRQWYLRIEIKRISGRRIRVEGSVG